MLSLVRLDVRLVTVLVSERTKPLTLVAVPAVMVTDSGVIGLIFAASRVTRVGGVVSDIVSVSERIFVLAIVTVEAIVMVSVKLLNTL